MRGKGRGRVCERGRGGVREERGGEGCVQSMWNG